MKRQGRLTATGIALTAVSGTLAAFAPGAHAAPSYQDGFLAFDDGSAASWTVIGTDGANQHTVTPSGGGYDATTAKIAAIKYSPDATHVAFIASAVSSTGLWVSAADGTGAHKLTDIQNSYLPGPAWSPDGSSVYFANGVQTTAIFSARADGTGSPTQAFTDAPGCSDRQPQTTTQGYLYFQQMCHASNGYAILRPGDSLPTQAQGSIYKTSTISPDGTRIAEVYPLPSASAQNGDVDALISNPAGNNDIMHPVAQLMSGSRIGAVVYGPSGSLAYTEQPPTSGGSTYVTRINIVPDHGTTGPRLVTAVTGTQPVTSLDWVDGKANFGARPTADRIGGGDRVATSVAASQWSYDAHDAGGRKAYSVVLARSDNFADALGGTSLAIQSNGPLMLTPTGALDKSVAAELTRILAPNSTVYILGGTSALSPAVEAKVQSLGFRTQRLGGANRYATAVAIAEQVSGSPGQTKTVMVATGADYPDALAAGVAAGQERYTGPGISSGQNGGVVVLTDGAAMPPDTAAYLKQVSPQKTQVYAVGGQAVKAIASAFPSWTGVTPLAGANRYETAAKVAASPLFGHDAAGRFSMVGIATGGNWPDALSGGALIGNQGGPLLLADANGLPVSESPLLTVSHLSGIAVFGGTAVVKDAPFGTIADTAFGAGAWDPFVNRQAPGLP